MTKSLHRINDKNLFFKQIENSVSLPGIINAFSVHKLKKHHYENHLGKTQNPREFMFEQGELSTDFTSHYKYGT